MPLHQLQANTYRIRSVKTKDALFTFLNLSLHLTQNYFIYWFLHPPSPSPLPPPPELLALTSLSSESPTPQWLVCVGVDTYILIEARYHLDL